DDCANFRALSNSSMEAGVVKLVYTRDLKFRASGMRVRPPPPAPIYLLEKKFMGTLSTACPHCKHDRSLHTSVWQAGYQNSWHTYLVCSHCNIGSGFLLASTNELARTK